MTEKCGEVVIRDAVLTDAERIREIYDHYVRHTAISFEYETPTPEEMRERMHRTMARFPYLAAERDGVVQGYAYAGPFKERAAYDWCCELSIYLAQDARKCGMGRRLYAAMEERTKLYAAGDKEGIDALEKRLLAQNAEHKDWACTEEMMKLTRDGKALYMHCLPADITGLSCEEGEVDNSVFDRYIVPLYKQASYKPYIIAAMIFMSQVKDPVRALMAMDEGTGKRKSF